MGKKSASPPPTPDYSGAAKEQAAASKEIATQQTWANRPDQYTPWGAQTWNSYSATDPSTGQPVTRWTQQETINPELQGALDQQLGLQNQRSQLAGGFMGRVAEDYAQPFDWTNLPGMSGTPQERLTGTWGVQDRVDPTTQTTNEPGFAGERQRIEEQLFQRMRPEQQRQEDTTRTMLANMGLTPGSEAYNRELQRLHENQSGERYNALQTAGQEQARMQQMLMQQQQQAFGQNLDAGKFYNQAGLQGFQQDATANQQNFNQEMQAAEYQNRLRQQAIAEQQLQRGMSLNELNALISEQQVQNPNMPQFMGAQQSQTPNLLGATQNQYAADLNAFNAQQAQSQGMMSGLFGLGGAALGGPLGAMAGKAIGSYFEQR